MRHTFLLIISLFSIICHGQTFKNYENRQNGIMINLSDGKLGIYPLTDSTIRINFFTEKEIHLPELIFKAQSTTPKFTIADSPSYLKMILKGITVIVDKKNGSLSFADKNGKIFLKEKPGTRKMISNTAEGESFFSVTQGFESAPGENIFGLGQFQDGHFNLKGVSRRLIQVNSQIALPFIYSDRGYGLLWHQYGLTDFNPAAHEVPLEKLEKTGNEGKVAEVTTTSGTQKVSQNQSLYQGKFNIPAEGLYSLFLDLGTMGNRYWMVIDGKTCLDQSNMWLPPAVGTLLSLKAGEHQVQVICKSDNTPRLCWREDDNTTTFQSPHASILDYVVFYGPSADQVIAAYRGLSGNAPMFPKWAYGFWQCRERYTSGKNLVETVKEFRQRKLPMDVIVQDWQYWGNIGWGVPQFDTTNYAHPEQFIKEIHDLNAHFNISIWSNPDKNSSLGKTYEAQQLFIPNTKWLDYFNPATRESYWNTLNANLFSKGVDSWWMDATEPENDALKGEKTHIGSGNLFRLTYPLMVSQAVYEGQRKTNADKRVCILTRSAFLGQQRFGIINWSGDIGSTWDAFKRQVVAGLNYSMAGFPYWTTDIGGFFRPGNAQYTDEKYHELLTRWFQWGTFNPIFRIHGYQSETEPWKYGAIVEENMRKMLKLRYQLLHYIYSEAWNISKNGYTIMRPLVMDFRQDSTAVKQPEEFMFGHSILVAPVTQPDAVSRTVYLPKTAGWYNYWTNQYFKGGDTIQIAAPLDQIPLFIKAGSILPFGPDIQYATEKKKEDIDIFIYEGANGSFTLYEDENDGYNYEKGIYSTIPFTWEDEKKTLTIGNRQGEFPGMLKDRHFKITRISEKTVIKDIMAITYSGKTVVFHL